ncbi:hypothetical protein BH18ACI4_BH18ACI4_26550 [soil metagenome]
MALPNLVYGQASPLPTAGRSLFSQSKSSRHLSTPPSFHHSRLVTAATLRLQEAGLEILQVTPFAINIAATHEVYEEACRTKIVAKELRSPSGFSSTHLDSPDTEVLGLISTVGTRLGDVIEGIALEVPRVYMSSRSPLPTPPPVDYWHLDVPADVAAGCNATPLHQLGITWRGVRVAMVDSGWYRHPYFTDRGYRVAPVVLGPGASLPEHDESGHGTGESANILAIAPECELLPVKANFVNTIGAFNEAVALLPDIITCSWGSHSPFMLSAADEVLAASVEAAVASGITVIFSAGNGHAGFPGQHPDVISAGGVFLRPNGTLEASSYSSGFSSFIFPGRRVPDVCGLVGMRPRAIYIMLPVEPGDNIDNGNSGNVFPDGDETVADDGWAAFSGTSAAAPQLAGAVALIRQVAPLISPVEIKAALTGTARDVIEGACSPVGEIHGGLPAEPGDDSATGYGLMDVFSAVVAAYYVSLINPLNALNAPAIDDSLNKNILAYYQGVADAAAVVNSNLMVAAHTAYMQGVADYSAALASMMCSAPGSST